MKKIYSIGEVDPWNLTKESGFRLLFAILNTKAEVISYYVDTTCPPIHVIIRLQIEESKKSEFIEYFKGQLYVVDEVMGSVDI